MAQLCKIFDLFVYVKKKYYLCGCKGLTQLKINTKMKKMFFALLLAIVGTTMTMADEYNYRKVTEVPDVGHYTWYHEYNPQSRRFTFFDQFHYGAGHNRKYIVHVYERKPGQSSIIMRYKNNTPAQYYYGVLMPNGISENEIGSVTYTNEYMLSEFDDEGHTGGNVEMDLTDVMVKAEDQEYTELRIVVEMLTREKWEYFRGWYPVETESRSDCGRGLFHNNYLDVDLPVWHSVKLTPSSQILKYGDNFQLTADVWGSHPATLTIQYSTDAQNWVDLDQRTITAADAKKGYTFTYKRAFLQNGMDADRVYRLKVYDKVRGTNEYTDYFNVSYFYNYEDKYGNTTQYKPGLTVFLGSPSEGKQYYVTSDIPVDLTETANGYKFTMPACNVRVQEVEKVYTVRFFDYDYTLLKEQQVAEGKNATPPTTPTHAGMTFTGWDGAYTNVQKDIALHALYSVEGVEVKLAEANGLTYVKEGEKINLNIYVKTPTAVVAKAYIQNALLETEDQETLNWSENTSSPINFTAAQAQAGTTQVKANQSVFANGSYGRARYFRVRVHVGSEDIYSNTIRIDTYYPITINAGEYNGLYTEYVVEKPQYIFGSGIIYSRPGDILGFIDANAAECELSLYLANGTPADVRVTSLGGYTATVLLMPVGYGSNAITVSHKKHTVLFYAAGHVDGYWNLIYGDGVYAPQEVLCGGAATPPEVNDIPGKVFCGWYPRGGYAEDAYTDVTEDMAFDALLEDVPTFTVTFKDWDGFVLSQQEVAVGESALPPLVENRYGFDFIGWDEDFSCVTTPLIVIAQYEAWPEGVEEVSGEPKVESKKTVKDGVLFIERNGRIYNAQGAEIK